MENRFSDIIQLIKKSRINAIKAVNAELINLYWNVGQYIAHKINAAQWGDKTVDELANYIQKQHPELKGFNRRGLYRMCQFFETYKDAEIVSSTRTQFQSNENPSIGVLLCKDKDVEVVEYALSRSLSPTMVSNYQTQLPDKEILQKKLHELFADEKYDE